MQSSHANAPVAQRKAAPDGASRTVVPGPQAGDHPHTPALWRWEADRYRAADDSQTMTEHNPDPYKVLHLARTATARDIGRAYRTLVRTRHPDTRHAGAAPAGPDSTAQDQRERQELQEIMDAYAVLGDPARRAAYDRQRPKTPPPKPAPPHRDPGPSGPALIIGPVRCESPTRPGTPVPGRRLLWWIRL
jgi:hypothetical protein